MTVSSVTRCETKVKGSQFIGVLSPAETAGAAESFIGAVKKEHHTATHNCFAYRSDKDSFRYSDDGEPSGTAGRPILAAIDKFQLQGVVLVVTRYFGGTKLGTGGLIRAYGNCAELVIESAKIVKHLNFETREIAYPFSLVSKVHHLANKFHAKISEDANTRGMVAKLEVLPSQLPSLKKELISQTAGKIKFL